jgi:hypothetical protein
MGHQEGTAWPHIQGLQLADPQFYNSDSIELLLGAEVCSEIFKDGLRKGGPHDPIAQKTSLGWILSGGCGVTFSLEHRGSFQCTVDHDLEKLVHLFWEQEREPAAPTALTPEETKCEDIFVRTHYCEADGRYVVRLPFARTPDPSLIGTRKSAQRMLTAMEKKCAQDSYFGDLYRQFMCDYESLGHMEIVSAPAENARCYLPHHGVLRESSASTKLRVVFNGSQQIQFGESLNAHLLVGENLLPALADLLLRWRWHRYVIVTDVEKMYRQIVVHPDDRDFQRILWRYQTTDHMREFRITTVTVSRVCRFSPSELCGNWRMTKGPITPTEQGRCAAIATWTISSPALTLDRRRSRYRQNCASSAWRADFPCENGPPTTTQFSKESQASIGFREHHTLGNQKVTPLSVFAGIHNTITFRL